jgi:hypothetical protein
MSYIAPNGEDSNMIRGARFEEIVREILLERFKGNVKSIVKGYHIPEIAIKVDFYIITNDNNIYFFEAKYRNGARGRGLKKEEATNALTNYATMLQRYAKRNKIKKYYFECYTNGIPNSGTACDVWLKEHFDIGTLHAIHVIEDCEERVEDNLEQETLEEHFKYG